MCENIHAYICMRAWYRRHGTTVFSVAYRSLVKIRTVPCRKVRSWIFTTAMQRCIRTRSIKCSNPNVVTLLGRFYFFTKQERRCTGYSFIITSLSPESIVFFQKHAMLDHLGISYYARRYRCLETLLVRQNSEDSISLRCYLPLTASQQVSIFRTFFKAKICSVIYGNRDTVVFRL